MEGMVTSDSVYSVPWSAMRNFKRVLLINPKYDSPMALGPVFPLGLGYIGAYLTQRGHFVRLHDMTIDPDLMVEIDFFTPDIIGIGCQFTKTWPKVVELARVIKQVCPEVPIIVGGAHPSACPQDATEDMDRIVVGPGEGQMRDLVEDCQQLYQPPIDSLPHPRPWMSQHQYSNSDRNSIITSRGCPNNCNFCSVHTIWGRKWEPRSPEGVVDEIQCMIRNYGIWHLSFDDDNILVDQHRATDLFELMIRRQVRIPWNTPNGVSVNQIRLSMLNTMLNSGCYALNLAIESGDERMLEKMNKRVDLCHALNVVTACKKLGILTLAYFVIGYPGETMDSILRTVEYIKKLKAAGLNEVNVFVATPYPGTKLWEECDKEGMLVTKDYELYTGFNCLINTQQMAPWDVDIAAMEIRKTFPPTSAREKIRRPKKEMFRNV